MTALEQLNDAISREQREARAAFEAILSRARDGSPAPKDVQDLAKLLPQLSITAAHAAAEVEHAAAAGRFERSEAQMRQRLEQLQAEVDALQVRRDALAGEGWDAAASIAVGAAVVWVAADPSMSGVRNEQPVADYLRARGWKQLLGGWAKEGIGAADIATALKRQSAADVEQVKGQTLELHRRQAAEALGLKSEPITSAA